MHVAVLSDKCHTVRGISLDGIPRGASNEAPIRPLYSQVRSLIVWISCRSRPVIIKSTHCMKIDRNLCLLGEVEHLRGRMEIPRDFLRRSSIDFD